MPVAIETVIIVIVVVSGAVLGAVVCAIYWLWRLLLEDRRCSALACRAAAALCPPTPPIRIMPEQNRCHEVSPISVDDSDYRAALLAQSSPVLRPPRIARLRSGDVVVDERGRNQRSGGGKRERGTNAMLPVLVVATCDVPEVVVIDDTEPPPPYEAIPKQSLAL